MFKSSENTKLNGEFPTWWTNLIWKFFKEYFRNKLILVGVLIFIAYWGIPLLLSLIHNTLLPDSMGSSTGHIVVSYFNDFTHFIFAVTISFAGIVGIYTLYKIPQSINNLYEQQVLNADFDKIKFLYLKNRKIANGIVPKVISSILMILSGIIFFNFYYQSDYDYWWGNIQYGYENIYFVVVIMAMVYFGTKVVFLFILYSKFLLDILDLGITPRVFHYDDSNGLHALGNIIILKWLVAVFIIVAVFIVLFYGYMGLENTFLTKLLIGIFSLSIPIIAILPLLKSLKELSVIKKQKLKLFGSILNQNLDQIEKQAASEEIDNNKIDISNFLEVQQIFLAVKGMNVFPFNPKALTSVIIIYGFQIGLTIYKLITG